VLAVFTLVVVVALLATLIRYQLAVRAVAETVKDSHLLRRLLVPQTLAVVAAAGTTD
jgi:hypothetical protein